MTRRILYLASNNHHKQEELKAMAGSSFEIRLAKDLDPDLDWDETGATFEENARIKAHAVKALTPHAVLADDSGLEVAALGGLPGVHSSRYAGVNGDDRANNAKLLAELARRGGFPSPARFVCTLVFIDEDGREQTFTGTCEGQIVGAPRGGEGFGYDPLFEIPGTGRTLAELSAEEKNQISHRRRAVEAWLASLGL